MRLLLLAGGTISLYLLSRWLSVAARKQPSLHPVFLSARCLLVLLKGMDASAVADYGRVEEAAAFASVAMMLVPVLLSCARISRHFGAHAVFQAIKHVPSLYQKRRHTECSFQEEGNTRMISFAIRIKEAREQQQYTREHLAEMVGVTSTTIYRWERGSSQPSPIHQRRLREILPLEQPPAVVPSLPHPPLQGCLDGCVVLIYCSPCVLGEEIAGGSPPAAWWEAPPDLSTFIKGWAHTIRQRR